MTYCEWQVIYLSSKVETCRGIPVQFRPTGKRAEIIAGPKSNPRWASGGYSVHLRNPFWNSHSISVIELAGNVRRTSRWWGRCRSNPGRKCIFCGISINENKLSCVQDDWKKHNLPTPTGLFFELVNDKVWRKTRQNQGTNSMKTMSISLL